MSKPLADRLTDAAKLFPKATLGALLTEGSAAAAELDLIRKSLQEVMHSAFNPELSTERNLHRWMCASWS